MSDPTKPPPELTVVIAIAWEVLRENLTSFLAIVIPANLPIDLVLELTPFNPQGGMLAWLSCYKLAHALDFLIGTITKVAIIVMTAAAAQGQLITVDQRTIHVEL